MVIPVAEIIKINDPLGMRLPNTTSYSRTNIDLVVNNVIYIAIPISIFIEPALVSRATILRLCFDKVQVRSRLWIYNLVSDVVVHIASIRTETID